MAEMVEMGSLDAMMLPQGQIANYCPKINALGLPFLFSDYESVYKVLDSEIGEELVADFESRNMIQIAYWENGLRQVTNSKKPINTPADLAGLKIRTPEDKMTIAIFTALGASPSPLAFSELYLALQQGTFDGQENPVSNIYANNYTVSEMGHNPIVDRINNVVREMTYKMRYRSVLNMLESGRGEELYDAHEKIYKKILNRDLTNLNEDIRRTYFPEEADMDSPDAEEL